MKRALRILLLLAVLRVVNVGIAANTNSVPEFLSSITVGIDSSYATASGIAFTRKDSKGKPITLIWTAGHIVYDKEEIDPLSALLTGETNLVVQNYTNFIISQDVTINGKFAYKTNLTATVLKCSPDDTGHDLAILRVNGKFFNNNSVTFDLSGRIPKLGEPLYGVSCPFEEWASFSSGVLSFVGRTDTTGLLFDQTTLVVYPGSSGGGAFTTDGKCIGINDMLRAAGVSYIIPIRRMQEWVKEEKIEWALDPSVPMPSEKELKSLPEWDKHPAIQPVTNKTTK